MCWVKQLKKIIIFCGIFLFEGCNWSSSEHFSIDDYKDLMSGDFSTLSDVKKLFPSTVIDVDKNAQYCISIVNEGLDLILKLNSEDRTFNNTALAFDRLQAICLRHSYAFAILEKTSPDKNLRDACHDAFLKLKNFTVDVFLNRDLYLAFCAYMEGENIKKEKLNEEQEYYLQEIMKSFKKDGCDLPKEEFERVKKVKKEIAEVYSEFEKNININKNHITASKEELSGLKEDFIKNLNRTDDGKYILGCDYPTYYEVRENCSNENIRKKIYFAFSNRAYPENIAVLGRLIAKRDELARMLKFESFAHFNLDNQMAKNPNIVEDFLKNLIEKTMRKQEKELHLLMTELPEGVRLDENDKINPWDYDYIFGAYKKKHFNVDEREIAKYFPLEHTLTKIFEIYQQFFGLKFVWSDEKGFWHDDVKVVQIYDGKTDEFVGTLLLDLFPRDDKYKHACMESIVLATENLNPQTGKNEVVRGVVVMISNFPKPTPDHPALLKHGDVATFFHELGHTVNAFLGRTQMAYFSGTSVKRDFVETPSQMFEEWLWDKQILKMISSHYKTGESLPDDLIDKKLALRKFDGGYWITYICCKSFLALEYFASGGNKNTDLIRENIFKKYMPQIRFEPQAHLQCSFGHLTEYGAQYYVYMWSKVFALDLFDQIKKVGLLDFSIGKKFRDEILKKGGSVDPDKLLQNFLGRAPKIDAFLKTYGIVES